MPGARSRLKSRTRVGSAGNDRRRRAAAAGLPHLLLAAERPPLPACGGIGVTELGLTVGLTVGLTAAGMSEEAALATTLLYRISCFNLPPVWGFFALRWLQRRQYL